MNFLRTFVCFPFCAYCINVVHFWSYLSKKYDFLCRLHRFSVIFFTSSCFVVCCIYFVTVIYAAPCIYKIFESLLVFRALTRACGRRAHPRAWSRLYASIRPYASYSSRIYPFSSFYHIPYIGILLGLLLRDKSRFFLFRKKSSYVRTNNFLIH